MKKYISSVFVFVSFIFLMGCDVYKMEGTELYTEFVTAYGNRWTRLGTEGQLGCLLYQDFEFPEISSEIMDRGLVTVYFCSREKEGNSLVDRDHPLPYMFTVENDSHYIITQNVRYSVEHGFLRIIIEWGDSKTYMQPDQKFKVCILTPDYKYR